MKSWHDMNQDAEREDRTTVPADDGGGDEKALRRESRGSSWTMRSTSSFDDDLYLLRIDAIASCSLQIIFRCSQCGSDQMDFLNASTGLCPWFPFHKVNA
ncbi:penicillin-binding protein activator [Sesbania bispinosa]|nr:penicillin-binding protein activator [Sesbania bispinosa]